VTIKEAQQAQDVVLDMFFASSHPAKVLFNLGASHSFISSTFIAKHHLPRSIMKHSTLVSSPGGERRIKHICPAVSIIIRGAEFMANLIILDSKGIDIILGMNWLRKYDGVILCAKRVISLAMKNGTTVEFSTVVTTNQANMLNQVHGTYLDEIRVVQEYPYVFPEEFPGMPPDHDIEFIIDLLPRMHPISKRLYRMTVNELVEVKKQIAELQSKYSFALVHPLGEHMCCSWGRKMEHSRCAWIIGL
jgi:hypothetical protein